MALTTINNQDIHDDCFDLSENLTTLHFEKGLSDTEKRFLNLRIRSHALRVYSCAQASYFVSIINETRHILSYMRQKKSKLSNFEIGSYSKTSFESHLLNSIKIGVIGYGHLGSVLVECLLSFGEVLPEELKIVTRRPEMLVDLKNKGVYCTDDCQEIANSCHIIFLCVLPNQLTIVADVIRGLLSPLCIIYSFLAATPIKKLQMLLKHDQIITTNYEFNDNLEDLNDAWNFKKSLMESFADPMMLCKTSPLSLDESRPIKTSRKVIETFIYALINICNQSTEVNREDIVEIVNAIILGNDGKTDISKLITERDITRLTAMNMQEYQNTFPNFNLVDVATRDVVPITKILKKKEVKLSFNNRYLLIFKQYLDWKKQTLKNASFGINNKVSALNFYGKQ